METIQSFFTVKYKWCLGDELYRMGVGTHLKAR